MQQIVLKKVKEGKNLKNHMTLILYFLQIDL